MDAYEDDVVVFMDYGGYNGETVHGREGLQTPHRRNLQLVLLRKQSLP